MIWGMGSGRCGTKSLAKLLSGDHEPQPWIIDQHILYQHRGEKEEELLQNHLLPRFREGKPCVDLKHSFLIPLIQEIDPDPKFIVMYRDPFSCIQSFLTGGSWTERNQFGKNLFYPKEGFPKTFSRLDKAIWYWKAVYTEILNHYHNNNMEFRSLESLAPHGVWENKYPDTVLKYSFTEKETYTLHTETNNIYDSLRRYTRNVYQ